MEINLPSHYKSWYHLWKEIEKNNLLNEHKVFFLKEEREYHHSVEKHEFYISDIKEMLLKELLENRGKVQEFTYTDLRTIEHSLKRNGFSNQINEESGILGKVRANANQLYEEGAY